MLNNFFFPIFFTESLREVLLISLSNSYPTRVWEHLLRVVILPSSIAANYKCTQLHFFIDCYFFSLFSNVKMFHYI